VKRELPMHWVHTTLDSVAVVTQGQSPPGSTYNLDGKGLPFFQGKAEFGEISPTVSKWCTAPTKISRPGDVLISIRAPVGPTNLNETTSCIGRGLSAISPQGGIPPRFFLYYLRNSVAGLVKQATGTTFKAISGKQLRSHPVLVPPLPEQHRIVQAIESYLTRLDDAVATLERVQRNLKRYRASVLKAAVEGRLVPTEAELARKEGRDYEPASVLLERILVERRKRWIEDAAEKGRAKAEEKAKKAGKSWTKKDDAKAREAELTKAEKKYKEPANPDTTDLPELPEGWCWTTLHQHVWSVKDGPHYSPKYSAHGIPFISGGNVRPSGVDFESAKRISPELHAELSKRVIPERGDILYTKGGTTGIARVNTYDHEFNVWVHVAVLKLSDSVEPFYIQHALNSPACYAQSQAYTHGVGNQDLGLTRMIKITIPLPPIEEQIRLVTAIERLDSLAFEIAERAALANARLARLHQAILKWAFEGKLVDQDPNDEPASILLDRIKAERERLAAKTKPAKKRRPRKARKQ